MSVVCEFGSDEYTIRPVTSDDIEEWEKDSDYNEEAYAFSIHTHWSKANEAEKIPTTREVQSGGKDLFLRSGQVLISYLF